MVGVSANDDSGAGCRKAHPGQIILRQHYLFVLWLGALSPFSGSGLYLALQGSPAPQLFG